MNINKYIVIVGILGAGIIFALLKQSSVSNNAKLSTTGEKIYVAVEGDSKVSVIDRDTKKVIKEIDLSVKHESGKVSFSPHNIQVAPDGKSVWVTANSSAHLEKDSSMGDAMKEPEKEDEVVVIDPIQNVIIKRISIAKDQHLAHVVISPNNNFAYVTAQEAGAVYKINARNYSIEDKIKVKEGAQPHGLRITSDESTAYIALLNGNALGVLDLQTDTISYIPVTGATVQAGVTLDGNYIFASVYDKKQLALYSLQTKKLSYINLPSSSKGPLQMYATPDSKYIYLADQGYYYDQPTSNLVYKVDIKKMDVVAEIKAGSAPHGVVVSQDGKYVYITNLLSQNVSVIDTATDKEVAKINVGKEPNGISIWNPKTGGTQ